MTIKENEMTLIHYTKTFENVLVLKNATKLLLDSIRVYAYAGKSIKDPIPFEIYINGTEIIIYPKETGGYSDFILTALRLVQATMIHIKSDEYISKTDENDEFIYALKE